MSRVARLVQAFLLGSALCSLLSACRADSYALLIGIDEYQQSDAINGLAGASNDAKALAQTLEQVSGFPADHVRVLTSDGDPKPTGANITFELDQLSSRAKPGDLVFVLFSGHGIEMDGNTYLVPWDADARTESTLRRTSLPEPDVKAQLASISARGLILAFDMCRSDPRKGSKSVQRDNLMGRQAKDLQVVPVRPGAADAVGPRAVVTLFSCSPGERSWEWQSKDRGYFSYFLEQGLRHDAADSKGIVRVNPLVAYVQKSVSETVKREQGQEQRPYCIVEGSDTDELILARAVPGSTGKAPTNVAVLTPDTGGLTGRFDALLTQGKALIKSHQWDEAQAKFAAARELQPASAQALTGLGQSYAGLKRYDEADRLLQQARKNDPHLAAPVRVQAEIAFNKHDLPTAERLIRQAYDMDPKDPETVGDLGLMYLLGKHDVATGERYLRQSHTLDPTITDAVIGLGLVAVKRGNTAEAQRLLLQAYRTDPKNSLAAEGLGMLAMRNGDASGAEKYLRESLTLDSSNADAAVGLGQVMLQMKNNPAEAERFYRKAMTLDPNSADPLVGLAMISLSKGDVEEAERLAQSAKDLDPSEGDPLALLCAVAIRRQDPATAEQWARKAVAKDDTQGTYHALLATCLLLEGDRAGAMTEAKRAIALGDKTQEEVYTALGLTP